MLYTIMGFNQQKMVEYGMDFKDAAILLWFTTFMNSGRMTTAIFGDNIYYWINYKALIEDIPMLDISSEDVLRRRLKKMEDNGILIHYTKRTQGNYSMYNLGKSYLELVYKPNDKNISNQKFEALDLKVGSSRLKSRKLSTKKSEAPDSKVGTKDNNTKTNVINNSFINNNNTNDDVVVEDKDVNELKTKIKNVTKNDISYAALIQLIESKGIDTINLYIENYNKFQGNINNPVGFLIKAIMEEWQIPKEQNNKNTNKSGKPVQSTNFEQRQYDDEYFESLYENFK